MKARMVCIMSCDLQWTGGGLPSGRVLIGYTPRMTWVRSDSS